MRAHFPKLLLALLLWPFAAQSRVEAPDHVIYGNVSVFGTPAPFGTVIEARTVPAGDLIARYELGRDARLGQQFALRLPMDTVDPRRDGYARPGDPLQIFVSGQLAANTSVGAEGVAVRLDLDPQNTGAGPSVIVADVSQFEGQAGPGLMSFGVTMNTTSEDPVQIEWSTIDGSATGGVACQAGVDFVTDSGVAIIAAGMLSGTIPVLVCGDALVEPDESFVLQLTRVVNGVPARTLITGTILDDDDVPVLTVSSARVQEPAVGVASLRFRATLSRSSLADVRFTYATQDIEAAAAQDYVATSGEASIAAGQIETVIEVGVLADANVEAPERLRLVLSNVQQASLAAAFALGTIDDPAYDPLIDHDGDTSGVTSMVQPSAIAISPDGAQAYVASESGDRVLQFARAANGDLTLAQEYRTTTPGFENAIFDGARDLLMSSDGQFLYVAAMAGNGVTVLARDAGSGDLSLVQTQADEQADAGAAGGTVRGLKGATAMALAPDGSTLHVVGAVSHSLVSFARDAGTGQLAFLEAEFDAVDDGEDAAPAPVALDRPADVLVSPDGNHVYVAARFGDAVLTFARDGSGGAQHGRVAFVSVHRDGQLGMEGIGGAHGLAMDATGQHLYVASEDDNAVVLFDRGADGSLTRRRQWSRGDTGLPGMGGAQTLALSPDGAELYVAGFADNSLTAFARRTASPTPSSPLGDLLPRQTVFDGDGDVQQMAGPIALASSPDGQHVYVAAFVDNAIVRFRRLIGDQMFRDGFESP